MIFQKILNAYPIRVDLSRHHYSFVTDSNILYKIYSIPGDEVIPGFSFSSKIHYVGFYPVNDRGIAYGIAERSFSDTKIMNTILNFIYRIFEDRDAIVAFNYSPQKGKHRMRNRLFNIHFVRHNNNRFHKMDFELGEENASIIFRKDNIYFSEIAMLTGDDILKKIYDK